MLRSESAPLFGDDNSGGADNAVFEPVARLVHLDADLAIAIAISLGSLAVGKCLMHLWIKGLANCAVLLKTQSRDGCT